MRKILFVLAVLMALALGGPPAFARDARSAVPTAATKPDPISPANPVHAHPALWMVKDHDTTIYLFGTIHMMKPQIIWFEGDVRKAYARSDEVVTEVVDDDAQTGASMLALAAAPPGQTIASLLPPASYAKYLAALADTGTPAELMEKMKPWFVSMSLSLLPLRRLGYDSASGVDVAIKAAARADGKRLVGLETSAQQLGFFDALPLDAQTTLLTQTVDEYADISSTIGQMVDAWSTGDEAALAANLNDSMEATPALAKMLLYDRNQRWAAWIKARLSQPGTVFLAVGAGHLAGAGSVQDALAHLRAACAPPDRTAMTAPRPKTFSRRIAAIWIVGLTLLAAFGFWIGASVFSDAKTARPALWKIEKEGRSAWLFGTLHAVPAGSDWLSADVTKAAQSADLLIIEVTGLDAERQSRAVFDSLGKNASLPPVAARLNPADRKQFKMLVKRDPSIAHGLDAYESWAAALLIGANTGVGQRLSAAQAGEARFTRMFEAAGKPLAPLETIKGQLGLFDAMPEQLQRKLLTQAVREAREADRIYSALFDRWAAGDVEGMALLFNQSLKGDPAIRAILVDQRNARWARQIDALLAAHDVRPFIAVGAGHLLGPGSLQARLEARGWHVTRIP